MSAAWPRRAIDWLRDAVGLGDAEGLVLLPVDALAVPAAVLDEAAPGAARHFWFGLLAVDAGPGVVAGGGLLLHNRHGWLFGRGSGSFFFSEKTSFRCWGKLVSKIVSRHMSRHTPFSSRHPNFRR